MWPRATTNKFCFVNNLTNWLYWPTKPQPKPLNALRLVLGGNNCVSKCWGKGLLSHTKNGIFILKNSPVERNSSVQNKKISASRNYASPHTRIFLNSSIPLSTLWIKTLYKNTQIFCWEPNWSSRATQGIFSQCMYEYQNILYVGLVNENLIFQET